MSHNWKKEKRKGIKPGPHVKSLFYIVPLIELGAVAVKVRGARDALLVVHY